MMEAFNWTVENWGPILGTLSSFILVFDRLSKLTPTDSDNKIVYALQRIFTILGVRVPDIQADGSTK